MGRQNPDISREGHWSIERINVYVLDHSPQAVLGSSSHHNLRFLSDAGSTMYLAENRLRQREIPPPLAFRLAGIRYRRDLKSTIHKLMSICKNLNAMIFKADSSIMEYMILLAGRHRTPFHVSHVVLQVQQRVEGV